MPWEQIHHDGSIEATDPALVAAWGRRLDALGFDDPSRLHPFARRDLAHDLVKHRLLVAYQMGLGKTSYAIAAAAARGTRHTLFVVPRKTLAEWESELARLGFAGETKVIETLADINGYACPRCGQEVMGFTRVFDGTGRLRDVHRRCPDCDVPARFEDRLARFNLITLRQLWSIPGDSAHAGLPARERTGAARGRLAPLKHTFDHTLRRRCEAVVVDEAYTLANPDTLQSRAIALLRPRRRMLLTGTPVRGYPDNILSLLTWMLGNGTDLFPHYDATLERSRADFEARFGTTITTVRGDGSRRERKVPRIRDPKAFQAMLAPHMRRRVNTEPTVATVLRMPDFVITPEQVDPDPVFRDLYEQAVERFTEWYELVMAESRRTGKPVSYSATMTRLALLSRLATVPQAFVTSYEQLSAKQARVLELIEEKIEQKGHRTILFSEHLESLDFYAALPELAAYRPITITGKVPMTRRRDGSSRRTDLLDDFRHGESRLLLASVNALAEGVNIPQAGAVVFDSFGWTPSVQQQAWSRVLRPAQTADPVEIHLVGMAGTIDDYLSAISAFKRAAIGEGIDHETIEMDFDDLPGADVYARHLVEVKRAVTAAYDATAWRRLMQRDAAAA